MIVDNGFKGKKFIVHRYDDLPKLIFIDLIRSIRTKSLYYGILFTPIDITKTNAYEKGFPNDIANMLINHPNYFNIVNKPVIGTILIGKYKGLKFSLIGSTEINTYFSQSSIRKAILSSNISSGCLWEEVGIKEAIPLADVLNLTIRAELQTHLPICGPYKAIIKKGPYEGYIFYIASKKDYAKYFYRGAINNNANGLSINHKGCLFSKITLEELPSNYSIMTDSIFETIK